MNSDVEEMELMLRHLYRNLIKYCVENECRHLISNISFADFKTFCKEHTPKTTGKFIMIS